MPRKAPLPRMGPNPTPITEYLALHREVSMMSLARTARLHYDTIHKAEKGQTVPAFSTMLKLQQHVGIPVMAWAKTKAVQLQMEQVPDPDQYNRKQNKWRRNRRANDPEYGAKERAKFKRSDERKAARKRGEVVPDLPIHLFGELEA